MGSWFTKQEFFPFDNVIVSTVSLYEIFKCQSLRHGFTVDLSRFDLCICLSRLILDKTKVSIKSFVQQFKVEHVVYLKKGIVICIQSNRFHFALYMYLFGRKYPYVVIDKLNWIFGRSVYIICLLVVSFIHLNYLFMPHCCYSHSVHFIVTWLKVAIFLNVYWIKCACMI